MIWKQKPSIELLEDMNKNTITSHLGIIFTAIGSDSIEATMPVNEKTRQPRGILHGGASVVLAETLGSMAAWLCLDDPGKFGAVGVAINANHLSSTKSGEVLAVVKPIKIGRSIQVWSIEVVQSDKAICICRLTTMTVALG